MATLAVGAVVVATAAGAATALTAVMGPEMLTGPSQMARAPALSHCSASAVLPAALPRSFRQCYWGVTGGVAAELPAGPLCQEAADAFGWGVPEQTQREGGAKGGG